MRCSDVSRVRDIVFIEEGRTRRRLPKQIFHEEENRGVLLISGAIRQKGYIRANTVDNFKFEAERMQKFVCVTILLI
jgi:hypothetical protein